MNRLRLSAAYVAIMLAGLLIFAAAAVFAVDRTQRSTLDARLKTAARAAAAFVDVSHGAIRIDADDRQQFLTVLGADSDGAVLDPQGGTLLSSAARVPPAVSAQAGVRAHVFNAGSGDASLRAYSLPMMARGGRIGSVVVWRSNDWIEESDRNLAIVLGAASLIIAGLALLAGNIVTRRALQDAFARQRRFTADASHELRAPLAVIRAEADLALRKERESLQYRAALQTIAAEADHMESLVGDLLSAARAESGKFTRERTDVRALLTRVAERLRSAAAAKDARVDLKPAEGLRIMGDAQALERALLAVGHNAVRYAPAHGTVTLSSKRFDYSVEIAVEDTGPGFSSEALEHALERFWREPGAPAGTGTGLGLAIARSIVEAHAGSIALSNAPHGGGVVRLRFPAA